jgi:hypothetical protein
MTAHATDALVASIEAAEGLPVPIAREFATRIEHALAARGYEVVRTRTDRGDLRIVGYPCTCFRGGCLEHPFGPERQINP